MAYGTVTQLREYLEQVKTGTATDAVLSSILDRASDLVTDALGLEFAAYGASPTARDVRAVGGEWLGLPAYKAASITTILAITSRAETYETTAAVTGWVADEEARPYRVYRGGGWTRDTWYRVTAIWGYGAAPTAIVEVTLEAAVNIWRGRDAAAWQNTVGAEGQGSVTFNRALTWAQRSIIDGVRARYLGVVHA